ncbi:hypothetical protein ABK040_005658 [Willaertia magna]
MGQSIAKLIQELPITSPIRRPIIAKICETVKSKDAKKESDDSILMMKSKPNITRKKMNSTDIDKIQKFWYDACRVSSTDVLQAKRKSATSDAIIVPKYWQDSPTSWIYQQYIDFCTRNQYTCCSVATFTKYQPTNIRPSKKLEGVCPICKDFQLNKTKYQQADQLLKHFEQNHDCNCESSTLCYKFQIEDKMKYWRKVKENLQSDKLILVMDFASGWEVIDKAAETTNEFFEKYYIKDMIVVIVSKSNNEFHYTYIDLINDNHTSDHHYVREAFNTILTTNPIFKEIRKIFLFSDGGPAHYKIAKTVVMIGEMSRKFNINIEYNFYPSHHGKNLCDAHTGVGKKYIKNKVKSRKVEVQLIDDIELLLKELKGTQVIRLDNIQTYEDYNVSKIDSVRLYHQYIYEFNSEGNMSILCKISYEDEETITQNINLLTNSGEKLNPNYCLFCEKEGHNHRVCKLLEEEYTKEEFNPLEYNFLSRENSYFPDSESESESEIYSESEQESESESELESESESDLNNQQLTVGKRAGRGNRLCGIINSLNDTPCQNNNVIERDPVVLVLTDFTNNNQEEILLLKKKFENQQKGYAKYLFKKQEVLIQHKNSDYFFKIPLEFMYDHQFILEILQNTHKELHFWDLKQLLFFFKNDKEIILQCLKLQTDYFKEIISVNDKFTNDINVISLAIKKNIKYFEDASSEIQNSKECILKLLEINPKCYFYLLDKFKKDSDIIEKIAVSNYGYALDCVPKEFKTYDIALTAVKQKENALFYVPKEILDETIIIEAIKKSGFVFYDVRDTKFYKERHLNLLAAQKGTQLDRICEDFRNDKEIVLEVLKNVNNQMSLNSYFHIRDETLRRDKEICLMAAKGAGKVLGGMSDEMRDDKDVVIHAIRSNEFAIEFASERLRNDKEIAIELFSKPKRNYNSSNDYCRNDFYILNTEEEKNRKLTQQPFLSFFSKEIQEDKEIAILAFKFDNNSLYCIPERLRKDKDFMMKLIEIRGRAVECVSDDLKKDKEFCLMAVTKDYNSYQFLTNEMKCELFKEWLNYCQQDQRGIQLSNVLIDIKKQYELTHKEYEKDKNILYSWEKVADKDMLKELAKYNDCIYYNIPSEMLSDEFLIELRDIRHKYCYYECRIPNFYQ